MQYETSSVFGHSPRPDTFEGVHYTIFTEGGFLMYGAFGGYTQWAVVFLIIFVLFFLFVPAAGAATTGY